VRNTTDKKYWDFKFRFESKTIRLYPSCIFSIIILVVFSIFIISPRDILAENTRHYSDNCSNSPEIDQGRIFPDNNINIGLYCYDYEGFVPKNDSVKSIVFGISWSSDATSNTASSSNKIFGPTSTTTEILNIATSSYSHFEFFYSVDGANWINLGRAEAVEGEANSTVVRIPVSIRAEDLSKIQVNIRYVPIDDELPTLYLKKTWFTVEYNLKDQEVEIDNSVEEITANSSNVLDKKVESSIDSEFDSGSIKRDFRFGNIKAIILEKGGMLELWYHSIDPVSKDFSWKLLVGDSSIDSTSPLAIEGKTIFWLDKNKQTLFGFNIENSSMTGEPIVSNMNRSFMDFDKEGSGKWRVTWNIANDSFSFMKSPDFNQ
jgi:hypothetical protein